jgi:S1-C subfamily serine protease
VGERSGHLEGHVRHRDRIDRRAQRSIKPRRGLVVAVLAIVQAIVLAGCVPAADMGAFESVSELPSVAPALQVDDAPTGGATTATSAEPRADSVQRRAREMTVRIRSSGCGSFGTGSGFAIGDGVIVTNRHVVTDATQVSLNTWDGGSMRATVDGVDYTDDLALVRIDADPSSAGQLADSDPEVGTPVTVVGYPLGGAQTLTSGKVVDYARLDASDGPRVVRVSAEIWPGNSGGPVLDDAGRVVAVVFAIERATDYALAVPVSQLRDVLAGGPSSAEAPQCGQ